MPRERLRVALAGFGNVGRAVARLLTAHDAPPGLVLDTICTRQAASRRVPWIGDHVRWTADFGDVLHSDADVVVELIGGVQPAETWIEQALERGKSVVTANKQVIARSGGRLEAVADAHGCELRFEASVGGVVPIIRALRDGLAADRVRRIAGILNGTCNYILSRIEATRASFATALGEAQAYGFAEADPAADLDGLDARAKLAILATLGFRRRVAPDLVCARSIRGIGCDDFDRAREQGCTVRQIAWAECADDGVVRAAVEPSLVPLSSPFARTVGSQNVIVVSGERAGDVVLTGRGAGPEPTAVAVVSDVLSIAGNTHRCTFPTASTRPVDLARSRRLIDPLALAQGNQGAQAETSAATTSSERT
jgi:homoserine dehydrogenase